MPKLLRKRAMAVVLAASFGVPMGGSTAALAQQGVTRAQSNAIGGAVERRVREAPRPTVGEPRGDGGGAAGADPRTAAPAPVHTPPLAR